MATIKDVAALAGVSISTVSIVINGKAASRNIPAETCEKVKDAVKELNYIPNQTARNLRNKSSRKPRLALFFARMHHPDTVSVYFKTFLDAVEMDNYQCDVIIRYFDRGNLQASFDAAASGFYEAVAVVSPDEKDTEYLKSLALVSPLVLINVTEEDMFCVSYDKNYVASNIAKILKNDGCDKLFVASRNTNIANKRSRVFRIESSCKAEGITIEEKDVYFSPDTAEGGVKLAETYCNRMDDAPKYIYADSDKIARGMLYYFHKRGVKVPEDVKLLTVFNTNIENARYCVPSLTGIDTCIERVMKEAFIMIKEIMENPHTPARQITFISNIYEGESFPFK